jgi:phage FluMu protein Com
MTYQTFITKGKAALTLEGLRCRVPRDKDPTRSCNKLIVKKNSSGQIAGSFMCERCKEIVEVETAIKSQV